MSLEKVKTISEIEKISERLKKENKKIITTNGVFDILHSGHVDYLEKSKKLGDILIVLLNSDNSVRKIKGEKRPIIPEGERASLLSALECVDYVVIFNDEKPLSYLSRIKPDIHTKAAEVSGETRNIISEWGGKYEIIGKVEGMSTTKIIEEVIKKFCRD
ncbi:MAG: adenylyltransferase/cytidyltransferase family protein [Nanoarchaeota archaeon]